MAKRVCAGFDVSLHQTNDLSHPFAGLGIMPKFVYMLGLMLVCMYQTMTTEVLRLVPGPPTV